MKSLLFLLTSCTQHIHNHELLSLEIGMSYNEVVENIGKPHIAAVSKTEYYEDTNVPYRQEVFVYRSHNDWLDASSHINNCYFIYADKVLRQFNCH